MKLNSVYCADSIQKMKELEDNSVHLILSDIPYGISFDSWDVLHTNTNSALLGSSPAQEKAGAIFKKRGKPLNGWSEEDKLIAKQYYDWVSEWAPEWYRVLKPGASVFVFAGRRLAHRCICAFEDTGFTFKDLIAWDKVKAAHRAKRISVVYERRDDNASAQKWEGWKLGNLRLVCEPILWFQKPYKIGGTLADNMLENEVGAYNEQVFKKYGLKPNNIISISSTSSDTGLHPTQKPLKLMELLIELTTTENQIVVDPFCGSGTTLAAALILNRKYIGIEQDKTFYDTTVKRLSDIKKDTKTLLFA